MTQTSTNEKNEPLQPTEGAEMLERFWSEIRTEVDGINIMDFRASELPLARIKKIMKLDDDVKMISAEVPILFAKAAEIFIHELTLRAWLHTEESKRRTLQRNDVAMAITKYEQFDFLIDIVPREESKPHKKHDNNMGEVQYIVTLPQTNQPSAIQLPNGQVIQLSPTIQSPLVTLGNSGQQYAILSQSNQLQTPAQYFQIAAPQVTDNIQQQQSAASTKNLHVSTTTPNVIQPQQRSATSAHITITAAQLQQILNASQKTNNSTSPATKGVQQIDNNNQSSDETTMVDIKQQPV
jgi:nuclear transcription factor Y gamma